MASQGLAQIDENSSLVQANCSERLVLPTLLAHSGPQHHSGELAVWSDSVGEKTPEASPRMGPASGNSTPEAWPNTPTPHGAGLRPRYGFALGDQTPESWPDFLPSFRIDAQQPCNPQAFPVMIPSPGVTALPMLAPMWPGQIACPVGMVFDGNVLNMVNMDVSRAPVLPLSTNALPGDLGSRFTDQASRTKVPVVDSITTKVRSTTIAKKPLRGGNQDAGVEDACPVAVYVDLSTLRERAPVARGHMRQ